MWLEVTVVVLVVLQVATLALLWHQGHRTQRLLAIKHSSESGSVPELLLINALNKIDHRLGVLDARTQQAETPRRSVEIRAMQMSMPATTQHASTQHYELAQQMARDGSDLEQLIARCGLSRNEAELVMRLHAKRA